MTDVLPHRPPSPTNAAGVHVAPTSPEVAPEHADVSAQGFITMSAACRIAGGCCPKTVKRALSRGQVRGLYIAGWLLLDANSIRRWAEARRVKRGGPERRGRPPRLITATSTEEESDGK